VCGAASFITDLGLGSWLANAECGWIGEIASGTTTINNQHPARPSPFLSINGGDKEFNDDEKIHSSSADPSSASLSNQ
jgi:hypothetical protein